MTATELQLARGLRLPLAAVTETIALLGIRGSGKTNTAVVLAEELLEHGQQVVILDPVDVWWGLKHGADGKSKGYPIAVLGGRHADVPIAAGDGATIADFVVEHDASAICSLRHFESRGDQRRFITDFANRLYHRKGERDRQTPLMVIVEEASLVVPQRVMGEDARMVAAIQRLVRQGRSSGFGVTLIDQRASTVNKDVLTQLELLICHRTSAPQDRKALEAWIDQHDAKGQRDEFLEHLASLPQGTAWVWSPGWLDVFRRVEIRKRRTFDSSRTPKPGERVVAPGAAAPIDIEALSTKLKVTIEKARADDPKALHAQIRELEKQLRQAQTSAPAPDPAVVDRAVAKAVHETELRVAHHLRQAKTGLDTAKLLLEQMAGDARAAFSSLEASEAHLAFEPAPTREVPARAAEPAIPPTRRAASLARTATVTPAAGVSRPQQRMLNALASFQSIGISALQRNQLAVFSDQSPRSSGFEKNVSTLRTLGLIDYPSQGATALTDQGMTLAAPDEPATLDALHEAWCQQVSGPQARMLRELVRVYPRAMLREDLAERTSQSPNSSGWEKNLSTLRQLGAIDYPDPQHAVATALLFPEGLR